MIGPAAVFLPFSFLFLYTSPGGWRGRAKPISSTRHPGRSGVTFHLISNNVIINNFSFHSLGWTNVKKKCAVPVSCRLRVHVFCQCILTHICTRTHSTHHAHSHTLAHSHTHTETHAHTHTRTPHTMHIATHPNTHTHGVLR